MKVMTQAKATSSESRPLRMLFWESTARCNLQCLHCRRLETSREASREDLSTDEVKRVFDSAAALGEPVVVFSGGEPLMRDDWEELAAYAGGLNLPTALATNGTLIDAKTAGRIVSARFRRVSVSLDGADNATHDAFRGQAGAFERALEGIDELHRAGTPLQINATVANHNADQLDALYALAGSLGAEALHLFLLVPVGCGVRIAQTHQLAPDRYESILNWVFEHQDTGALRVRATCAPHFYRVAAQRGRLPPHSRGCLCGVSVAFVSHTGEVFPCGYLPVHCGSVRENDFAQIWRTSRVFADLRDYSKLRGKCGRCEFRAVCGGCRARAFALTGDYLAAEPACTHQPARDRERAG